MIPSMRFHKFYSVFILFSVMFSLAYLIQSIAIDPIYMTLINVVALGFEIAIAYALWSKKRYLVKVMWISLWTAIISTAIITIGTIIFLFVTFEAFNGAMPVIILLLGSALTGGAIGLGLHYLVIRYYAKRQHLFVN